TLRGHAGPVQSVAFLGGSQEVISAAHDSTFRVWDAVTGQEKRTLGVKLQGGIAFSPDGRLLATGAGGKEIVVWDIRQDAPAGRVRGVPSEPTGGPFSPDSRRLLTGHEAHTVQVWDAQSGRGLLTLRGLNQRPASFAQSADGRYFVAGGTEGALKVWDAA